MGTANISVFHCRHIRSSDPLQPSFPSLLVWWEIMVAYVRCFTSFCWIILSSRDTSAHHFLGTLTCKENLALSRYSSSWTPCERKAESVPRKFLSHVTLLTKVTRLVVFQDGGTLFAVFVCLSDKMSTLAVIKYWRIENVGQYTK